MDVDVKAQVEALELEGEPECSPLGGSLKRAGEDLEGREEKRAKEEEPFAPNATPAVPAAIDAPPAPPAALPTVPAGGPPPPWLTYTAPPPKPSGPTTPLTVGQHRHLLNTIRTMKKNSAAANFLVPVDVVKFGIPHYAQVIEYPMDLGTVETKLYVSDPRGPPKDKSKMSKWDTSNGSYANVSEVALDVRQVWENTRKFNGPTHLVSEAASKLETTFEKSLNNLPTEVSLPESFCPRHHSS